MGVTGRIIKGIAGFYYVAVEREACEERIDPGLLYECKARGAFRKDDIKPLVGDLVEMDILDREHMIGNIIRICGRQNSLIRPAVANVDQALIVFAMKSPQPKFSLLERFLVYMRKEEIPVIICFHKTDLSSGAECERLLRIYGGAGVKVCFTTLEDDRSIECLKEQLIGSVTAICGPSGVGKSSLINRLQRSVRMETGEISRKIERGRHTTRHAQLIAIDPCSYIIDTPGFTSLFVDHVSAAELEGYYPEFAPYRGSCAYTGCSHTHEPSCAVKEAAEQGKIPGERYESYCALYEEQKQREKERETGRKSRKR